MIFYPLNAPLPEEIRTHRLLLRPLRSTDVELDYDAVMSSAEQLRAWSQSSWPTSKFTLEQNLTDLQRHEREHGERKEFTFTVLNPYAARCLGCVYIFPVWTEIAQLCTGALYAAGVRFWVRTSEIATDLDKHVLATLRGWFATEWAFDRIVFASGENDTHQTTLLHEAGFKQRGIYNLRCASVVGILQLKFMRLC